jgi:hypothetical protein
MKLLSSSVSIIIIVLLPLCECQGWSCGPDTELVKKALIYRNGHVTAGFYHVLLMVVTRCNNMERYHVLDLMKVGLKIRINQPVNFGYCPALEQRSDTNNCIRPCSEVYQITRRVTMNDVQAVIDDYNGDFYAIQLNDCRSFVRSVLSRLGQTYQLRCARYGGGGVGPATSWRIAGRITQYCETVNNNSNC